MLNKTSSVSLLLNPENHPYTIHNTYIIQLIVLCPACYFVIREQYEKSYI